MKRCANGSIKKNPSINIAEDSFQRAQQDLWIQLRGSGTTNFGYLSQVEADIRSRLDLAFQQKMSTSLLVVGPEGCGKKNMIDSVLQSYNSHRIDDYSIGNGKSDARHSPLSVARVQGQVCTSDQDALCSIAGQLCLRPTTGRDLSIALEDLEDHFRQCALNGRPSVIVLQDVHAFATREKQVLIYTLLDYMHKPDMLFVVLGCTPCAHIQYMLEKRVLSRLNAQFVYVSPVSGRNVCDVLATRLQLPITGDDTEQEYRKCFNARVMEMFGSVGDKSTKKSRNTHGGSASQENEPELLPTLRNYTDWGKGLSHFLRVAQLAVCRLTLEQPYLKSSHITQALYAQDPCTLPERLSTLPLYELHLFACVARVSGRLDNSVGQKETATGKKVVASKAQAGGVHVQEVLSEFDRLTGSFRRKESTHSKALNALSALSYEGLIHLYVGNGKTSASSRLVTDQTLVLLTPPMYEVRAAFQYNNNNNTHSESLGRPYLPIVISDRIRRAVLEPLKSTDASIEGTLLY
jgi:hypothetical protein